MTTDNLYPEKISGAEILMRSLVAEGVETLFGYPGGAIMPVYDALYDYRDRLNHILVRHEQAAAPRCRRLCPCERPCGSMSCNKRSWCHQHHYWHSRCHDGQHAHCGYHGTGRRTNARV